MLMDFTNARIQRAKSVEKQTAARRRYILKF